MTRGLRGRRPTWRVLEWQSSARCRVRRSHVRTRSPPGIVACERSDATPTAGLLMIVQHLPTQNGNLQPQATDPRGSKAEVLLTSVFAPYAQDDEYGSRKMNPMELYHNQVTRTLRSAPTGIPGTPEAEWVTHAVRNHLRRSHQAKVPGADRHCRCPGLPGKIVGRIRRY